MPHYLDKPSQLHQSQDESNDLQEKLKRLQEGPDLDADYLKTLPQNEKVSTRVSGLLQRLRNNQGKEKTPAAVEITAPSESTFIPEETPTQPVFENFLKQESILKKAESTPTLDITIERERLKSAYIQTLNLDTNSQRILEDYLKDLENKYSKNLINKALELQVPLTELESFLEFTKQDQEKPDKIAFLTHAQRADHYISMLNQVEKSGSVSDSSLALRSKEENEALNYRTVAFSPNGRAKSGEKGLPTISLTLNETQQIYGNFVWFFPAGEILDEEKAAFLGLDVSLNVALSTQSGEFSFKSEASQVIEEKIRQFPEDRPTALAEARKTLVNQKVQVGISLDRPTAFCFVPEKSYPDLLSQIDLMNISEQDRNFLKKQLLPYAEGQLRENLELLKNNPELYWQLVKRQDPDIDILVQAKKINLETSTVVLSQENANNPYFTKALLPPKLGEDTLSGYARSLRSIENALTDQGFSVLFDNQNEYTKLKLLKTIQQEILSLRKDEKTDIDILKELKSKYLEAISA